LKNRYGDEIEDRIHEFVKENAEAVAQFALVRPSMVSAEFREKLIE